MTETVKVRVRHGERGPRRLADLALVETEWRHLGVPRLDSLDRSVDEPMKSVSNFHLTRAEPGAATGNPIANLWPMAWSRPADIGSDARCVWSPSNGWVASAYDAGNAYANFFDTLRLKSGFALRAYDVIGEGNNAEMWIIWAVPADAPTGCDWRMSQVRRHVAATSASTASAVTADASNRGEWQSLVDYLPAAIPCRDSAGIQGGLGTGCRLERFGRFATSPASAGRRPGFVG